MSFLKPPAMAPVPQPTQAPQSQQADNSVVGASKAGSLIETGAQGLVKKASTRKSSLIGGTGGY